MAGFKHRERGSGAKWRGDCFDEGHLGNGGMKVRGNE